MQRRPCARAIPHKPSQHCAKPASKPPKAPRNCAISKALSRHSVRCRKAAIKPPKPASKDNKGNKGNKDNKVKGKARVKDKARDKGKARVKDKARVKGKARVKAKARVKGKARVKDKARMVAVVQIRRTWVKATATAPAM